MTVPTTTRRVAYLGDGVTVAFTIPFKFITNADIAVYVGGALQSTGVTITGALATSGTATFAVAPAALASVVLAGAQVNDQQTSIAPNGPFPAGTVETMDDKAMIGIQQIESGLALAVRAPAGDAATMDELPSAEDRASMYLVFDADGNPTVSSGSGTDTALRTDLALKTLPGNGAGLVGFSGTVNYVAGTIGAILKDACVSVKMFPWLAKGDGTTDDTAAIQAALNSGASAVFLPPGNYKITALTVPNQVRFYGATSIRTELFSDFTKGSWLFCTSMSTAAVLLKSGTSCEGIGFWYPNQYSNLTGGITAPLAYPASIVFDNNVYNSLVDRCYFANSYKAVETSPISGNVSLTVTNCQGYPLYRGIAMDLGFDVSRIDNNLFSQNMFPGAAPGAGLRNWVQNNGIAFVINRQDGGKGSNNFCFGYFTGYYNLDSTGGWEWSNCSADGCKFPFVISGTSTAISLVGCGAVAINFDDGTDQACDAITIGCTGSVTIFSTRIGYAARDGIKVNTCSKVRINGGMMENIGTLATVGAVSYGLRISTIANDVAMTGVTIDCASHAYAAGVLIQGAGATQIVGNSVKGTGAGQSAVDILAGATNYMVTNNTWKSTSGVVDGGGAVNKLVTNNLTI